MTREYFNKHVRITTDSRGGTSDPIVFKASIPMEVEMSVSPHGFSHHTNEETTKEVMEKLWCYIRGIGNV